MKYIIAFFLLFISFNTYSGGWAPPYCPDSNISLSQCPCPSGTLREGNLCLYLDPPYTPPDIPHECSSTHEAHPGLGGQINCFRPCPDMHRRVYDSQGYAINSCSADCPRDSDYSLNVDKGICEVLCGDFKEAVGGRCVPICYEPEYRDPLTKQCVLPPEPVEPEPPKDCDNDISLAIQCLQIHISNLIGIASTTNIEEKQETNQLLLDISENIGKLQNGNNGSENSSELDLNQFNADVPFEEINPSNLSSDIFRSNASCPKDSSINLYGKTFSFKYSSLCTELQAVGNFILILSVVFGVMIVIRN